MYSDPTHLPVPLYLPSILATSPTKGKYHCGSCSVSQCVPQCSFWFTLRVMRGQTSRIKASSSTLALLSPPVHHQLLKPRQALLFPGQGTWPALQSTSAGEGQSQLSCSHTFWTSFPVISRCGTGTVLHRPQTSPCPRWQPRPRISTWPLVIINHCSCRTTGPDMPLSGNKDLELTMTLAGITGYSHQDVPHYT